MTAITRRAALGALAAGPALAALAPGLSRAQGPLEITIAGGEFRPIALALVPFFGDTAPAQKAAADAMGVISANLTGSGLFRIIPAGAHIQKLTGFEAAPSWPEWRAINAEALAVGDAGFEADGRLRLRFRVFDVATGEQLEGMQLHGAPQAWRRVAHKVSDGIYSKLTGEGPYFDSRIVFVAESGPKGGRRKALTIMDQDGANQRQLTDGRDLVLTPRFSPTDQEILYISYRSGQPQIYLYNLDTGQQEVLGRFPGMTFAPRFSPDGRRVAMSMATDGNTDIFLMELASRQMRRLTGGPSIDTAPSFSPDGQRLAFESDRGGGSQIYVMPVGGGEGSATRVSFGPGRYSTPVWSPRGDLIAFTKQGGGQFSVGVMGVDGSGERVLDATFHSEGPTWAPNGRVLSFFRESPGQQGQSSLWSVDITGRNLRRLPSTAAASDPAWSPLLR
jgi:TolB protein